MKVLKNTLSAAVIATAVFLTSAAQAATINNASTEPVPVAGKLVTNESVLTVITPTDTVVTLGAGESLSIDDSVTFTLSAGTFGAIAGGDLSAAPANAETYALVSGGAGSSTATFRVTGAPSAAAAVLTLTGHSITGTGLAANSQVLVTVDMSGFVGGAATALYGTPLTQINLQLEPAVTATLDSGVAEGTFDVATGFSTLTPGTSFSGPNYTCLGPLGNGSVSASIAAVADATTPGAPFGSPTDSATLFTISGPMTGVGAIVELGQEIETANEDGTAAPTPVSDLRTDLGFGDSYFNIDAVANKAWARQVTTGPYTFGICFEDTTTYDVSTYTLSVSRVADPGGGYAANANIGGGTIYSFDRNGSSFTTSIFGEKNELIITDRSGGLGGATGADGAIAISAFDAAGNAVTCGAGLVIPNIPSNGTVTVQGADVMDNCPGAKRIDGVVNSTSIYVSNNKKTEDGTTSQSGSNTGSQVDI